MPGIGGLDARYPDDQWHAAISRMVIACRADGPRHRRAVRDLGDPAGFTDAANRAVALAAMGSGRSIRARWRSPMRFFR